MKYKLEEVKEQAEYCLNCKTKPCMSGCPLQNNIPDFIKCIKEENYEEAFKVLSETTIFEQICGRICPQKSQCERNCVRGIKGDSVHIGELEKFVGDYALENMELPIIESKEDSKKIAIIGSGPSGLACSYYLSSRGFKVSIYEKHSKLGGLLRYGIPEFRLEKEVLDKWFEKYILNKNVKVFTNVELGKDVLLENLKKDYDAVVLAFGANVSNKMNIEGEDKEFVLGGNELLEYRNMPDFTGKKVAIIGGGNVAMDTSRTIKKLGAEDVYVVYRRAEKQMPAERKEIEDAKKEGIEFLFQTNIIQIMGRKSVGALSQRNTGENLPNCALNNRCCQIECVKTELIKKEGETREYPVNIEGSNFFMDIDFVILAVGSSPNKIVIDKLGLETSKWGYIKVDESYKTSDEKIYAVGDLIGTKQTVAWAARSGFECAKRLIEYDK